MRWLRKRSLATQTQHLVTEKLRCICERIEELLRHLTSAKVSCSLIPLYNFLEFESRMTLLEDDWLSWSDRQCFLRHEVKTHVFLF